MSRFAIPMTRRSVLLSFFALRGQWKPLFDGKTSNRWLEVTGLAFPSTWRIKDGCLRSLKVDQGGFQDIRTEAQFTEFEWRIEAGGNSGVKYLIERTSRWVANGGGMHARGRGAEYQIMDDTAEVDSTKRCGSVYGQIAPAVLAALPVGEFNRSRIVVGSGRVEHWLNDQRVIEYPAESKSSPLVLQHHNSNAWFRNLRIREQ